MTYNIITCGVGGQGLMLISNLIGVACEKTQLSIKTAETHGLAQRSGSIYTHIRIGKQVYSPLIPYGEADVLLGMEAIETLRYIEYLKPNGRIILNHYLWQPVQSTFNRVSNPEQKYISIGEIIQNLKVISNNVHLIDALDLAIRSGNPLTSNVVLIGALARLDAFPIPLDSFKEVIPLVVPKKAIDANLKALDLGFNVLNQSL